MKEIKFKGKDKANGKWIHGNLEVPLLDQKVSRFFILGYSYGQYQRHEVIPESVGQYVGLNDENGVEIYGRDVYKAINRNFDSEVRDKVTYLHGCYMFGNWNAQEFFNRHQHIEVIGNTHDNPELLEGR